MSLDFHLILEDEEVFHRNITHNLNKMAEAAGIYQVLWRPEEVGITQAKQCIPPLKEGLLKLVTQRKDFEVHNAPNGWGTYEHFIPFVTAVLTACCDYPEATIEISR